jgi:pyruvate formate lyase activating enzyme
LYDDIESDSIYFETTNGGLCFGGHEPLLQQSFIKNFIKFIREKGCTWKVGIETNLNYKLDDELIKLLDFIIVDVKSMNPDIYQSYTGKNNKLVIDNIKIIKDKIPDILIRVPLIKNFTEKKDIDESIEVLKSLGFNDEQIEIFIYKTK